MVPAKRNFFIKQSFAEIIREKERKSQLCLTGWLSLTLFDLDRAREKE